MANREQTRAVRDWARQNGFELSDRGRIPATVIEAFEVAHTVAEKPNSTARFPITKASSGL